MKWSKHRESHEPSPTTIHQHQQILIPSAITSIHPAPTRTRVIVIAMAYAYTKKRGKLSNQIFWFLDEPKETGFGNNWQMR